MGALPKAVQKQVDKAAQIADEYYGRKPDGEGAAAPGDPPAAASPAPAASEPAASATPPASAEPAAEPTPVPTPDWEQRYKVLQGKYNAEVPRLQGQVKELTENTRRMAEQLTATQSLLATLSADRAPTPGADAGRQPEGRSQARLVKEEEIKEFGPDLIDVVRRIAREEQATLIPEIDRRLEPVAKQLQTVSQSADQIGQRVARQDQQSVLDFLAEQVPDWKKQNEDPGFLEWLLQEDPYAGVQRDALLQRAFQANDGPRVVAFFKGYQTEHAAVTPTPPSTPAVKPTKGPQKKLDALVAPGTPRVAPAGAQEGSGKRRWTRKEIADFYSGRSRISAEERARLEADLFAAQREGRIAD